MKKHKTTYDALIKRKQFKNYQEEYDYLKKLIDTGKISPIKASGTNGKRPAMYRGFWVFEEEEDYSEYIDELKYKLSANINPEFYLKHPDVYDKEREYVIALSDYLSNRSDKLQVTLSENERSYDIWKKEKFLSGKAYGQGNKVVSAASLLRHCSVSMDQLNVYHTTEPLVYFSIDKGTPQNILISENLDPFYGMRKKLMSGDNEILGTKFSTLIYGGGKRVTAFFTGFEEFAEEYMKHPDNKFYYFGDLDYEGIGIYESFAEKFGEVIDVVPFKTAYEALANGNTIEELPYSSELQNKNIGENFWRFFSQETVEKMKNILESGIYVPQEKLSILDY